MSDGDATPASFLGRPSAAVAKPVMPAIDVNDRQSDSPGDLLLDVVPRLALASWMGYIGVVKAVVIVRVLRMTEFSTLTAAFVIKLLPIVGVMVFAIVMAVLVLIRHRRIAEAPGLYPRVVAFVGAFLSSGIGWLPSRETMSIGLSLTSSLLMVVGSLLAVIVMTWLGRSFSIMPEARRLVVRGPYRLVRHPLYLCEGLLLVGIFIQYAPPWCYLIIVAQAALQLERMRIEEGVLRTTFPEYDTYASHTARLIPGIY